MNEELVDEAVADFRAGRPWWSRRLARALEDQRRGRSVQWAMGEARRFVEQLPSDERRAGAELLAEAEAHFGRSAGGADAIERGRAVWTSSAPRGVRAVFMQLFGAIGALKLGRADAFHLAGAAVANAYEHGDPRRFDEQSIRASIDALRRAETSFLRDRVLYVFRRHSSGLTTECEYSKLAGDVAARLNVLLRGRAQGRVLLAYYRSDTDWTALTDAELVWWSGDGVRAVALEEIVDAVVPPEALPGVKVSVDRLTVATRSGERVCVPFLSGSAFMGFWQALRYIGTRRRA